MQNYKTDQQNTREEEDQVTEETEIIEDTTGLSTVVLEERGEERRENESLLEWIDRQLKEAEERKKLREQ